LNPDSDEKLTHVTLRVLGGVGEETQLRRGQLAPPYRARIGERFLISGAQFLDGAINLLPKGPQEILSANLCT
jgi:hypothetical protein